MVKRGSIFLRGIVFVSLVIASTADGMIYVDATAIAGAKNGTSWEDAFIHLQDALAIAIVDPCEIRVAQGTYRPDHDSANPSGSKQRTNTFQLISDVQIYGGFPLGGGQWNDRDPNTHHTILSGDLNGDDGPNFTNNGDNSYHVVTADGASETAILDGFIITAGNANAVSDANSYGGGIYNDSGSAVVSNCIITTNWASVGGGGMYNDNSSAAVTNCKFTGNSTGLFGGGMYNYWSDSLVLVGCTFTMNSADDSGGGMFNKYYSSPVVTNCTFSGNTALGALAGGGIYNYDSSSPTLTNCAFLGNSASGSFASGGAMLNYWYCSPTATNCLFSGNWAAYGGGVYNEYYCNVNIFDCTISGNSASYGGGIYNYLSNPTLRNCIAWGNSDGGGNDESAQIHVEASIPVVTFSCIQGLDTYTGSGNVGDDPLFVRDPNAGDDGWGDDPCTPGVDEGRNDDYGDLRLSIPVSPCVDSGNDAALPADTADLNGDGNKSEPTPLDLDGNTRIVDGNGDLTSTVDMGAYEFSRSNIARNPAEFMFFASGPGFDPQPQSLYISNSGAGDLNWEISSGCNWLGADPNSGSATENPDEVLLVLDTSSLTWGQYICQLTISAPDAVNTPQTVQVDLNIVKGDFDADGDVDGGDFGVFTLAWLKAQGQGGYNPVCDIAEPPNVISETDLRAFTENWLQSAQ
jgi:parallel beta-helix repeat protein